jgi:hypothetical protein
MREAVTPNRYLKFVIGNILILLEDAVIKLQ